MPCAFGVLAYGRSEAIAIPHVLVAASEATASEREASETNDIGGLKESSEEDVRGYYSDGAYVALPTINERQTSLCPLKKDEKGTIIGADTEMTSASGENTISSQAAYFERLKGLFHAQRRALHSTPSASAVRALSPTQLISLPPNHRHARSEWLHLMQHQYPSPVQLAVMGTSTALQVLRLLTTLLRRRRNVNERLSAWIWGLLGRLDDVGMLSSDEVCVVRELGKRAVWVMQGFKKVDVPVEGDMKENYVGDLSDGEDDLGVDGVFEEEEDDDVEANKTVEQHVIRTEEMSDGEIQENAEDMPVKEANHTEETAISKYAIHYPQTQEPGLKQSTSGSANETVSADVKESYEEAGNEDLPSPKGEPINGTPNTLYNLNGNANSSNGIPSSTSLPKKKPSKSPSPQPTPPRHRRNTSSPPSSPTAEDTHDNTDDRDEDLEAARARLLQNITEGVPTSKEGDSVGAASLQEKKKNRATKSLEVVGDDDDDDDAVVLVPDVNTRATLDMILTVAGEIYGQLDLLEERERWA